MPMIGAPYSVVPKNDFFALEASASIADSTGLLLCYTDAKQVWDRRNQPMPNGKLSADCRGGAERFAAAPPRQSAAIVPADAGLREAPHDGRSALLRSRHDPQNDYGDIMKPNALQIGIPVFNTRTTKALTAVRHADGINYWVVIHLF